MRVSRFFPIRCFCARGMYQPYLAVHITLGVNNQTPTILTGKTSDQTDCLRHPHCAIALRFQSHSSRAYRCWCRSGGRSNCSSVENHQVQLSPVQTSLGGCTRIGWRHTSKLRWYAVPGVYSVQCQRRQADRASHELHGIKESAKDHVQNSFANSVIEARVLQAIPA